VLVILKAFWTSQRSTIISAVIAIAVIAGLFIVFNALPANESTKDTEEKKQEQIKEEKDKKDKEESKDGKITLPATYTVVRGDHLWKISTQFYNTGLNWTLIAAENKLANPDIIHAGNILTIPKEDTKINARTHTVVKGDTLWDIAQDFYGSGFEWTKIANANPGKIGTLPNGNSLIIPGQVLAIP